MMRFGCLLAVLGALPVLAAEPRAISGVERDAVGIVTTYLNQGAEGVYERLADDAPLRALPREEALGEIAVRMGPRERATWTLRTAASDAAFEVAFASGYEDGLLVRMRGNRVREILTLAEGERKKAEAAPPQSKAPLFAAIVLAVLGVIAVARWRLVGIVLLALATAAAIIAFRERAPTKPSLSFVELRELLPLRDALAMGRDAKIPAGISKEARDVATLWLLQSGAPVNVGGTKDDPLASLTSVKQTPLAELLRARIALGENDEDAASAAFERATSIPPVRDDLLYEAAFSFGNARAKQFLDDMRKLGSRDAEVYYRDKSFDALRTAWTLEPKPREELIRAGALDDLRAKTLVSFFSPTEPIRRSQDLGKNALAWPLRATATVTGELLRVELGTSAIEIPNGAALAPPNARVIAATERARTRDAEALRDAREMLEQGGAASRTRRVRAAKALFHHRRWAELLRLTDVAIDDAPAELIVLRLQALLRANRLEDARALAGTSNAVRQVVDMRMRQVEVRQRLLAEAQTLATEHFDIRHAPTLNPAIAARIGELLEAELARIRAKLPPFEPQRITVNVLGWDEFRNEITQSDHITGLYDGEIFIPFAAVERFKREIVAIITHELTHALLAQATNDNAPRWFQEGVATRLELAERHSNAFAETPAPLVLPVTLLDATMERNVDPSAYIVAQTFIRFLEDRYGPDAISRAAATFARGEDDEIFGKPLDTLSAEFRQWGFHHTGEFASTEPWPYGELYSPGIDPRIRAGFKFGKSQ